MAEKKTSSRFCIQFNDKDSHHLQVMEILNAQGRHKAQYIAAAVLHYINCRETPAAPQDDAALRQAVESMVVEFLKKQNTFPEVQNHPVEDKIPKKVRQSSEIGMDNSELDANTMDAIRDSITAFRNMGG